jgi:hypothetical protein
MIVLLTGFMQLEERDLCEQFFALMQRLNNDPNSDRSAVARNFANA